MIIKINIAVILLLFITKYVFEERLSDTKNYKIGSIEERCEKALDFYCFYYYINMYLKIGCYDDWLFVKNTTYENRCESNRGLTRIRRNSEIPS